MARISCRWTAALTALTFLAPLGASDADRDFSGQWILDLEGSDARALPVTPERLLTISQQGTVIHCTGGMKGASADWSFAIDGSARKYRIRDESMSSAAKWEGTALLINTIVSGPRNYVIMDRWKLSRDHAVLTIRRQIVRGSVETEGTLLYRKPAQARAADASSPIEPPALAPKIAAPATPALTTFGIAAGTRIPLVLSNSVNTKNSRDGDRIYLETAVPVVRDGRIVIPRGSYVAGTVTQTKRPGRVAGKGELFIRFDSLTLPNGVTRDFRSRPGSADGADVDRREGKVTGEGNKGGDARTIATGAGAGATVGVITGRAAGRYGMGAGIGAAAGAAAGLAGVLLSRGPDAVLAKGTTVEMVLDRDLQFSADDLRF